MSAESIKARVKKAVGLKGRGELTFEAFEELAYAEGGADVEEFRQALEKALEEAEQQ